MLEIKKAKSFGEVKDIWSGLWRRLPVPYPFLSWNWQKTWWEVMKPGRSLIYVVSNDNNPLGIVPLRQENDTAFWLAGEEVSDYLDLIAGNESNRQIWKAVLGEITKEGINKIILRNLPENSASLSSLNEITGKFRLQFEQKKEDVVPYIKVPKTFDKYLSNLSSKNRHELRRKIRIFKREGGEGKLIKASKNSLPGDCEYFFSLFKTNGEGKKAFLTPEMEEFFLKVALEMDTLGMLDFSSLLLGDEIIAQSIAFINDGSFLLYNTAINEKYYHLSPGLMINKYLIEESIKKDRKIYDFMQGNEHYKYQLGSQDGYVYKMTINF